MLSPTPIYWLSSRQAKSPEHAIYYTLLGTKCLTLKYNITAVPSRFSKSMHRTVRLLNKAYKRCSTLTCPLPCHKQTELRDRTRCLLHSAQAWSA